MHFSRYLSIYLTALFVRLGVTANQVTGLMLIVGFASFLCAVPHVWYLNLAALVLFLLFYILDCCDGEVARWTESCSHGGVYLDYAAHVVCNCPLLAGAAWHGSLLHKSLFAGMVAFLTVMLALWSDYLKLITPALAGREARTRYSGDDLVPNRTLADAIRRLPPVFLDPILPPMGVIILIILSHGWEPTWVVAAIYGLLCSLALSVMYFAVGFTKAKRLDLESPTGPEVQSDLPVA